jgi:putative Mg2+ transporter-C (MgtC) family protein
MLVGFGAAMFVLAPQQAGMEPEQVSRVLQGVVAGIGFLGVRGLTTAASIWATAAIGVAVGMGRHITAIVATLIALAILALQLRLETPRRR